MRFLKLTNINTFYEKKILSLCLIATLGLTSCTREDENVTPTENKLSNKNDLEIKFKKYVKSKTNKENTSRVVGSVDYDLDNVHYNAESNAYYYLQKNFDFDSGVEQKAIFAMVDNNNEFSSLAEMGMTKLNNLKFTIKYYDAEQVLASVDYSLDKNENRIYFSNVKDETINATSKKDCGQGAAHCISGAYTNHGWMSVTLWVETLIIPETGIAVAGACIIKNCVKH